MSRILQRSVHTRSRRAGRRRWRAAVPIALVAIAALTTGCAKAAAEYAPAPPVAPSADGGELVMMGGAPEDAAFEALDVAESSPEPQSGLARTVIASTATASRSFAPDDEPSRSDAPAKKAKASAKSETTDDQHEEVSRQIVYTGNMQVSVFKVDKAMKRAEEQTIAAGGYVQQMAAGVLILRIPAHQLRALMESFADFGVVEARNLQAADVTEEYFDLRTRIRVLNETQDQLIDLLKRARNVEEALKVRQALDRVTMGSEQATGRLRLLENQIGFSTLTVNFIERGPHTDTPSSNDPFTWVDSLGVEATEWK